jgi:flagellar basal-body rod protein FlgF
MDKLLYVAMSGAKETLRAQAANSHNLANASTTAFKADLSAFQSRAVTGPGYASRVYATDQTVGWDRDIGAIQQTGNPLDLAIHGQGFFAVQDASGKEAYTRAGDLHVDPTGQLLTATGLPVLGDNGPISVPPHTSVNVGGDGTISIVPLGQSPQTVANVARVKLVNPPVDTVQRSADGLFRTTDGTAAVADAATTVDSGALESSNVDLASCMVNMIELARHYDLQVKALHTAEEDAASSTKLLQNSG